MGPFYTPDARLRIGILEKRGRSGEMPVFVHERLPGHSLHQVVASVTKSGFDAPDEVAGNFGGGIGFL